MNSIVWLDNLREIRKSFSRFLSIFAIITLGISFFVGVHAAGPAMIKTTQQLYDEGNLPDGYIVSTYGLTQADIDRLTEQSGTLWAPMKTVTTTMEMGQQQVKLFPISKDFPNFFIINEGRMIENHHEIVLDSKFMTDDSEEGGNHPAIGDTITLTQPTTDGISLERLEYEVVGFAQTPIYMERDRRGNGESGFAVIMEDQVDSDTYTEAYYWIEEARQFEAYTDEYSELVKTYQDQFTTIVDERAIARVDTLDQEIQDKLDDAAVQLNDGYNQLASGSQLISNTHVELQEGMDELQSGQTDFNQGYSAWLEGEGELEKGMSEFHQGRLALRDGERQLDEGRQLLAQGRKDYEEGLAAFEAGLRDGRAQLYAAQQGIDEGYAELQDAYNQLVEGQALLDQGYEELAQGKLQLAQEVSDALYGIVSVEEILDWIDHPDRYVQDLEDLLASLGIDDSQLLEWIKQWQNGEIDIPSEELEDLIARIEELESRREELEGLLEQLSSEEGIHEQIATNNEELAELELERSTIEQRQAELEILIEQEEDPAIYEAEYANNTMRLTEIDNRITELTQYNAFLEEQLRLHQEYGEELEELNQLLRELRERLDEILDPDNGISDIGSIRELKERIEQLIEAVNTLREGEQELERRSQELAQGWASYYQGLSTLKIAQAQVDQGWAEYYAQKEAGEQRLSQAWAQLEEAAFELEQGEEDFLSGIVQLVDGRLQLSEGFGEWLSSEDTLHNGAQDLLVGQLESRRGQYLAYQATQEFDESLIGGMKELREGQIELAKNREATEDLPDPSYHVAKREDFASYASMSDNARQLNVISNIFPLFFTLVAVLVTYTTIKRMTSEQRNYIGTMKQLGYENITILMKFLTYSGFAGILGVIVGTVLGYLIFPNVILNAYNIMYYLDDTTIPIQWIWVVAATAGALLTALLPAVLTGTSLLRTNPSQLLLPEPPKAGKRTFIERLTWLWDRLGFHAQMTIRNLLRYKGRNMMTMIGVAGCTMLIVTGYGISNTINSMVDEQFGIVQKFNGMTIINTTNSASQIQELTDDLLRIEGIDKVMPVHQETLDISLPNNQTDSATLMIFLGDEAERESFVSIVDRQTGENVFDNRPVITERWVERLGGDTEEVPIMDEQFNTYTIDNPAVAMNYAQHYLYMTPDNYEEIFDKEPGVNGFLLNYEDGADFEYIEEATKQLDSILAYIDMESTMGGVRDAMSSLDLITIILVISAAALSFVVLYNLTNINVNERMRELSTIKVLGFYNWEVSRYIFSEVIILTVLGSALGLLGGRLLTQFIMKTMQLNDLLFYPVVHTQSYIYSFTLSIIFASIVMVFMHRRIKDIDMVEALKAIE